jgi:hypothetical protein
VTTYLYGFKPGKGEEGPELPPQAKKVEISQQELAEANKVLDEIFLGELQVDGYTKAWYLDAISKMKSVGGLAAFSPSVLMNDIQEQLKSRHTIYLKIAKAGYGFERPKNPHITQENWMLTGFGKILFRVMLWRIADFVHTVSDAAEAKRKELKGESQSTNTAPRTA